MRSALTDAYRDTRYRVLDAKGGMLAEARVGERSASVDSLLAAHAARSGVFITGWNPRSIPTHRSANDAAHARLERELRLRGVRFLPHVGVGADPSWSEDGLFALDLAAEHALKLAAAFEQNAVVVVRTGAPAELLLTS